VNLKKNQVISLILADNVEELKQKEFLDDLLEEINTIRTHPKSYVTLFENFYQTIPTNEAAKKANAYRIMSFLKSTRCYGNFQRSPLLTKAAEARITIFKEKKEIKRNSHEDVKVFLSDFCANYLNFGEIVAEDSDTPQNCLMNFLSNESFETGARNLLFNLKMYMIGIAYDIESKVVVILIADNVEEIKNDDIYVESRWRKINRPILTEDEKEQIRRDFNKFDVLNKGVIFPQQVLVFMDNNSEFAKKNQIYYRSLKNVENDLMLSQTGMNLSQFTDECTRVIQGMSNDDWKIVYNLILNDPKKKFIDFEVLKNLTKSLGYKLSDEEITEIIKKLTEEKGNLDFNKFLEVIKVVENYGRN